MGRYCWRFTITDYNEFNNMRCALIHTEAYIFKKTSKYVYSFGSYQNENGEIGFGIEIFTLEV